MSHEPVAAVRADDGPSIGIADDRDVRAGRARASYDAAPRATHVTPAVAGLPLACVPAGKSWGHGSVDLRSMLRGARTSATVPARRGVKRESRATDVAHGARVRASRGVTIRPDA